MKRAPFFPRPIFVFCACAGACDGGPTNTPSNPGGNDTGGAANGDAGYPLGGSSSGMGGAANGTTESTDAMATAAQAGSSSGGNAGTSVGEAGGGGSVGAEAGSGGEPSEGGGGVQTTPTPLPDGAVWDGSGRPTGTVYAFPEALGFGRTATGGRGGTVVHVTNLNDSGAGSLRDAVSATGRTVVFDVGGYIVLSSAISVSSDNTIAGQTAPGDGIGLMGNELSFSGSTNVITRYLRVRPGCTVCTSADPTYKRSGLNFASASTMIVDHVSIEFAQWNNIDSVGATNITVQYSIDADPVGQQFAAHTETGPYTWYGNLFANAHNRCPLAKADTIYVDNVVYNYEAGYTAGDTAGTFSNDVVNNYFIAGPSTSNPADAFFQVNNQPIFISGTYLDSNSDGVLNGSAMATPGGATALTAAWSPLTATMPTKSAADAYAAVVAGAGASQHRDEVDTLVISDLTSLGKAGHLWTTPTQTALTNGGFGTIAGGTAPVDTDGDGMPDAWEIRYGLDPNTQDNNGDFDHTGYTNIEKYIDGLVDGTYP